LARYRSKDETDLAWNRIRRRLTRELDTQIADWREEQLNKLLSDAWTRYVDTLATGVVPELDPDYNQWIGRAMSDSVRVLLEADVADR